MNNNINSEGAFQGVAAADSIEVLYFNLYAAIIFVSEMYYFTSVD